MCMVLYVAADRPLPLVAWDERDPAFHVTELPDSEAAVRARFSKPYVYYAGSHEGCGCGFSYGWWDGDEPERTAPARESVRRLRAYLEAATRAAGPLELYACWSGDEGDEAWHRRELTPRDFAHDAAEFQLEERTFATVSPNA